MFKMKSRIILQLWEIHCIRVCPILHPQKEEMNRDKSTSVHALKRFSFT